MATYVLLTKIEPEALKDPKSLEDLSRQVIDKINQQCPEAKWIGSYATLGPYDFLDIFEAPDQATATKVALIVRSFGHATTETWSATPWEDFQKIMRRM